MIVKFTNFWKKANSTARPSEWLAEIDVRLKDDTSVRNPVIIVRISDFDITWNYAYIEIFYRRYYRVTDIVTQGTFYEVSLVEDDLASNRAVISNTTAYIQYCADSTYDIPDNRLTQLLDSNYVVQDASPALTKLTTEHTYVLQCIGKNGIGTPFSKIYGMTKQAVNNLAAQLYSEDHMTQIKNQFGDIANCVVSLKALPLDMSSIMTDITQLEIGNIPLPIHTNELTDVKLRDSCTVVIPYVFGDYRDVSCCTYSLYLPFIGLVELSGSDLYGHPLFNVDAIYSLLTRQVTYRIRIGNTTLATYAGQIGYDIPVSTYQSNATGALSAGISGGIATTSALAGALMASTPQGAFAGAVGAGISAITTIANVSQNWMQKSATMRGNFNGAGLELFGVNVSLIIEYHNTIAEPSIYSGTIGKPYCKVDTIGNHSGFIQCVNASVGSDCLDGEAEAINQLLNSGFYFE